MRLHEAAHPGIDRFLRIDLIRFGLSRDHPREWLQPLIDVIEAQQKIYDSVIELEKTRQQRRRAIRSAVRHVKEPAFEQSGLRVEGYASGKLFGARLAEQIQNEIDGRFSSRRVILNVGVEFFVFAIKLRGKAYNQALLFEPRQAKLLGQSRQRQIYSRLKAGSATSLYFGLYLV
jgi:hypothetical protein